MMLLVIDRPLDYSWIKRGLVSDDVVELGCEGGEYFYAILEDVFEIVSLPLPVGLTYSEFTLGSSAEYSHLDKYSIDVDGGFAISICGDRGEVGEDVVDEFDAYAQILTDYQMESGN